MCSQYLKALCAFSPAAVVTPAATLAFSSAANCCSDACAALFAPLTTALAWASTADALLVASADMTSVFSTCAVPNEKLSKKKRERSHNVRTSRDCMTTALHAIALMKCAQKNLTYWYDNLH